MFDIQEELKKLPKSPGVYIMHDKKDEILYVGKAVNLYNRVHQYFQSSRGKTAKILKMVSLIDHFEYIVTDSELEALVLENNLIKENRPRYNTLLRDDKTYPYIKVTVREPYPRIFMTRKLLKDKAKYFGPFPAVWRSGIRWTSCTRCSASGTAAAPCRRTSARSGRVLIITSISAARPARGISPRKSTGRTWTRRWGS